MQKTCTGTTEPWLLWPEEAHAAGAGASGAAPAPGWANVILAVALVASLAAAILHVRRNERRRRAHPPPPRAVAGAPYLAGAALGLLFAISLAALAQPIGVSGGILQLAGAVGRAVLPTSSYWNDTLPRGMTWQLWVLVGVVLGAGLAALSRREWRWRTVPDSWAPPFGGGVGVVSRWLVAFLAGVLLEVGAAIAGGCTSGLALSGGLVLAPGAFVFMAAMFATGIPTARLTRRWERQP